MHSGTRGSRGTFASKVAWWHGLIKEKKKKPPTSMLQYSVHQCHQHFLIRPSYADLCGPLGIPIGRVIHLSLCREIHWHSGVQLVFSAATVSFTTGLRLLRQCTHRASSIPSFTTDGSYGMSVCLTRFQRGWINGEAWGFGGLDPHVSHRDVASRVVHILFTSHGLCST